MTHALTVFAFLCSASAAFARDAATAPLQAALQEELDSIEYVDVPLEAALRDLLRPMRGRYFVMWRALERSGVARSRRITEVRLRDVSRADALTFVLRDAAGSWNRLGSRVRDGTLVIGTRDVLDQEFEIAAYDISGLVPSVAVARLFVESGEITAEQAEEIWQDRANRLQILIAQSVAPDTWLQHGGLATLTFAQPTVLSVRNTSRNQLRVRRLLATLRRPIAGLAPEYVDPAQPPDAAPVLDATLPRVKLSGTYGDLIAGLRARGVNIWVAWGDVKPDEPLELDLRDKSLRSLLELVFSEHSDPHVSSFRGVVTVTSKISPPHSLMIACYPVPDLAPSEDGAEPVIQSLVTVVSPDCWVQNGGYATVSAYGRRLVVRAAPHTHEQIRGYLAKVRAARPPVNSQSPGSSTSPPRGTVGTSGR